MAAAKEEKRDALLTIRNTLTNQLTQIVDRLPSDIPKAKRQMVAERFIKVLMSAANRNGEIAECTPASIMAALFVAAELGLEPGGLLGEAYLVPFNNKVKLGNTETWIKQAQLIPGYRGLLKLARQSAEVSTASAQVVYSADEYRVELGLRPKIHHVPELVLQRGDPLFAYAGLTFRDGGEQMDVMTKEEILKIKARSQTGKKDKGPWVTDPAEMWRKTVVKRMLKYAPLSSERLQRAQELDDEVEMPEPEMDTNVTPIEAGANRSKQLAAKIASTPRGAEPVDDFVQAEDESFEVPAKAENKPLVDKPRPAQKNARDGSDGSVPADQEPPEPTERQSGED